MEGFALLGLVLFGFIIFSIYFIIKQIDFVLNAIPLYREILNREDKIINLLQDIKQHHLLLPVGNCCGMLQPECRRPLLQEWEVQNLRRKRD